MNSEQSNAIVECHRLLHKYQASSNAIISGSGLSTDDYEALLLISLAEPPGIQIVEQIACLLACPVTEVQDRLISLHARGLVEPIVGWGSSDSDPIRLTASGRSVLMKLVTADMTTLRSIHAALSASLTKI